MVYFGGFFPKLEFSRGFLYLYLINIAGRISAAAMAGDIIFFCLAGPLVDYTEAHTGIFRRVFYVRGSLCSVALRAQRSSDRVQRSSDRVQCSSEGCSLAQRVNRNS